MASLPSSTGVTDVVPHAAERAPEPPSDSLKAARTGLWALAIGLGGFLLWAGLAPLDEGVPTPAQVTLDTKSRVVQHLSGGIVKAVLVKEGEWVSEQQPLIELDAGVARANHESVRQRYLGLRAMQGRLQAEQLGRADIAFHPDLLAARSDPQVAALMAAQVDLMRARRSALQAELAALDEAKRGQAQLAQSYTAMVDSRRASLRLIEQELQQTRPLVAEGYAPRNRLLELERAQADLQAALADLQGQISRARQSVAEIEQRRLARQQEYRKEVEGQLADVSREAQAEEEKLRAVRADLERTVIRSPAAGQAVGVAVHAPGAVVQPGQKLMVIVPKDEPLVLEARIAPHLIDKVKAGLLTDVRFNAFAHSPHLVVQGEVESVSGDLLTDPQTGAGFYLARIRVTPQGMAELGQRRMQPGMPADVVIKTGERTLLTYWMSPLTRRVAGAMKEE